VVGVSRTRYYGKPPSRAELVLVAVLVVLIAATAWRFG